ncbi:hypothetical protein IQ268_10925 [Oculatella sp. LEGE 06141]|uniref:hypothetical protein n=1 Tax=Oculatella sp. LEGE 06141 TaxID=1828648 RepID=UPI0018825885|nr:hypothetical protein [Oculatella sp. LEGE 06141]MBE9179074.1 hypothetical protein [Oculatella sp. LEGE 06141]
MNQGGRNGRSPELSDVSLALVLAQTTSFWCPLPGTTPPSPSSPLLAQIMV